MPILWSMLPGQVQEQLRKSQWRWHRKKLVPPEQRELNVTLNTKLEDTEQIGRLMRQAPRATE